MATVKTPSVNKNQALTILSDFLAQTQKWCNQPNAPATSDLETYLVRNFQFSSNGEVVGRSLSDYLNRITRFRQKYSHFDIVGPFEEPVVTDNKVALQYEVELTAHDGQTSHVYIMAFATLEGNKVSKWVQVASEQGSSLWDS